MSTTSRGEPQFTQAETSPARSVHPTMLETSNSQAGLAQSHFDSSSEADPEELHSTARLSHDTTNVMSKNSSGGPRRSFSGKLMGSAHHVRTSSDALNPDMQWDRNDDPGLYTHYNDASSLDSNESFKETTSPITYTSRGEHANQRRSLSPPQGSRHALDGETYDEESPVMPRIRSEALELHRMTLDYLERNEALDRIHSGSPRQYYSMTPQPLHVSRWLDKRPMSEGAHYRSISALVKKVPVVPPPIDTSTPKRSHPSSIIRTPHPTLQRSFRKDFSPSPLALKVVTPGMPSESVLTLSIRRRNPSKLPLITTMVIGSSSQTKLKLNKLEKTHPFNVPDFDDHAFFISLRTHYIALLGPFRLFSALTLSRITVSGPATRAADVGCGWLAGPRSPRAVAWKGLSDSFSEERLLYYFRNPGKVGKERFAWVAWAERIAAAPSSVDEDATKARAGQSLSSKVATPFPRSALATPTLASANSNGGHFTPGFMPKKMNVDSNRMSGDLVRKADQHEGLEFVLSWSVRRILIALATVMALSLAAALLWIFLGIQSSSASIVQSPGTVPNLDSGSGFRNAGDRVAVGILIGICTLLVGLTGVGGWIGASYLIV